MRRLEKRHYKRKQNIGLDIKNQTTSGEGIFGATQVAPIIGKPRPSLPPSPALPSTAFCRDV